MRRADRLLLIVQALRRRGSSTTAQALAEELEVSPRTIYRDVLSLQAAGVPIEGAAGVGYVLRPGYDLPPLMFATAELEAVVLGIAMVVERGDFELVRGAQDALAKIKAVLPRHLDQQVRKAGAVVPHRLDKGVSFGIYVPVVRQAIRDSKKLRIAYRNAEGRRSKRIIWPLGLYLYSHVTLVCAWCEERGGFRAFRSERIVECAPTEMRFDARNGGLMSEFLAEFTARCENNGPLDLGQDPRIVQNDTSV